MKTQQLVSVLFLINFSFLTFSQEKGGAEFIFNKSNLECITKNQRNQIVKDIKESQKKLKMHTKVTKSNAKLPHPTFIWPVKKAATVTYNEIWAISNYVDHNSAYPNQVLDYNGGTKTYDTNAGYNHQGVDIYTWPYTWKMLDDNGAEVIAAAPGQIIYKHDGEFDRSCSFNNNLWNAIYIKHNDGSVAWYGHLKKGSITTKNIGDTVIQGEFLGIVGSSGNSTGPHLHFEVYEDDSYDYDKLIDPYIGPSNNWNTTSWWQNQKPYKNPKINALTTNSNPPEFGNCPSTEITNEKTVFSINEQVYFIVFLKDQLGHQLNLKVYKPNNALAYSWQENLTQDWSSSYWWWSEMVDVTGQWRVECTLSTGDVVNHYFTVENSLSTDGSLLDKTSIYPNPLKDFLVIDSKTSIHKVIIRDVIGKQVFENKENFTGEKTTIPLHFLSKGLYFLTVVDEKLNSSTFKILKK